MRCYPETADGRNDTACRQRKRIFESRPHQYDERDEGSGTFTYEVRQTRLKKLVIQQKILRLMSENGYFETLLHSIVSINQSVHIQTYCLRDLWEFITENIGKECPGDELKKLLVEAGHITIKGRSQSKGIGWNKINQVLNIYGIAVKTYRKQRNHERLTYAEIYRI